MNPLARSRGEFYGAHASPRKASTTRKSPTRVRPAAATVNLETKKLGPPKSDAKKIKVPAERRVSPIRMKEIMSTEPDQRIAPDGMSYTKADFIKFYGSTAEWDLAATSAPLEDHLWFKEKLVQEEAAHNIRESKMQSALDDTTIELHMEANARVAVEEDLLVSTRDLAQAEKITAQMSGEIRSQNDEIQRLRSKVQVQAKALEHADIENGTLKANLKEAKTRIDELKGEKHDLIEQMEEQAREHVEKVRLVKIELREAEIAVEEQKKEFEKFKKHHDKEMKRVAEEAEIELARVGREFEIEKYEMQNAFNLQLSACKKELAEAQNLAEEYRKTIDRREREYAREKERMAEEFRMATDRREREHSEEIQDIKYAHQQEIRELQILHEEEKVALNLEWQGKLEALDEDWKKKYGELEGKYKALEEEVWALRRKIASLENHVAFGAANRIKNRLLSRAWEKWQFEYEQLCTQKRLIKGAINRMRNRLLSAAFEKWQYVGSLLTKEQFTIRGAINRMMKRKLSMAWEKWQQDAEQMRREKKMIAGAVLRLQKRMLSKAWEQWQWWYYKIIQFSGADLADKLDQALQKIRELQRQIEVMGLSHEEEKQRMRHDFVKKEENLIYGFEREKEAIFKEHETVVDIMAREHDGEKKAIIKDWELKYRELEIQVVEHLKAIERHEAEQERMRREHENKLKKTIKEWEVVVLEVEDKLQAEKRQAEMQRKEMAKLQQTIKGFEGVVLDLEAKLADYRAELAAKNREIETVKREAELARKELAREYELKLQEMRLERDGLFRQVEEGKRELERLLALFEKEKMELIKLHDREKKQIHADWEKKTERLQIEIAELRRQIKDLEKEIRRIKEEAERKYGSLMREVEEITGEKVVISDNLSIEKTATTKLRDEVARLKALIDALQGRDMNEGEMVRLQRLIKDLEKQLQLANFALQEKDAEVERIKRDASARYAQLSTEIEKITGIKMEVEGDLSEERNVTGDLREEIARLLRTIEELKRVAEENAGAAGRLRELEAHVARLQKQIKKLEVETGVFTSEWDRDVHFHTDHHHVQSPTHKVRKEAAMTGSELVITNQDLYSPPTSPRSRGAAHEYRQQKDLRPDRTGLYTQY